MHIKLEITDHLANITLSRPKVANALNAKMLEELLHALRAAADSPARVVRLCSSIDHFCAGADINWMRDAIGGEKKDGHLETLLLAEVLQTIWEMPKPVLAAVRGVCIGGGVGLIAAVDICLVEPKAWFRFSEVRLGVIPAIIAPYVVAAIGPRQARQYMLSADTINAERAEAIGLVHRVVDDAMKDSEEIARMLCAGGPAAQAEIKKLLREIAWQPINKNLSAKTSQWLAKVCAGKEAQEGLSAYLEERTPEWHKK